MKKGIFQVIVLSATLINSVFASGLQVSPVSITTPANKSSTIIHVSNESAKPIQAQIRIFSWRQEENKDVLEETDEIVASPPFVKLDPAAKQLVRLVRVRSKVSSAEENFRLLVDELPVPEQLEKGINLHMRYSIPLRILAKGKETPKPALAVDWMLQQDTLAVKIKNTGSARAQIGSIQLQNGTEKTTVTTGLVGYVLPDSTREWKFKLKDQSPFPSELSITIDGENTAFKKETFALKK